LETSAVIVTKNRKLLSTNILKSGKKPVATKLYGNDAYMNHTNFQFIVTMVAMFDGEWGPQP
jgi:hypothetical protein